MAKKYEVNGMVRMTARIMTRLIGWGVLMPHYYVLTVQGRKTAKPYSLPVQLIEREGQRWLVSPYGETSWVKNARPAGEVRLSRGAESRVFRIRELGPRESAPILREYLARQAVVRPYFNVSTDSALNAFEAEAPRHPVFLLEPK
jgi:deazaflavin-dependent oxidoreductase (nitroreductase family)